jgi:hypothetical protein
VVLLLLLLLLLLLSLSPLSPLLLLEDVRWAAALALPNNELREEAAVAAVAAALGCTTRTGSGTGVPLGRLDSLDGKVAVLPLAPLPTPLPRPRGASAKSSSSPSASLSSASSLFAAAAALAPLLKNEKRAAVDFLGTRQARGEGHVSVKRGIVVSRLNLKAAQNSATTQQ